MIIVISHKNLIKSAVVVVLMCAVSFNFFSRIFDADFSDKPGLLQDDQAQQEQISLAAFLASTDVSAGEGRRVEIFDVKKGKVVKTAASEQAIQGEAKKYLEGITGMYVKVKAFPDSGYIIRIPLNPPVTVQNQWLKGEVEEAFIILPQQNPPYLLVLDNSGRPVFFNFKGDTSPLLKVLDFQAGTAQ